MNAVTNAAAQLTERMIANIAPRRAYFAAAYRAKRANVEFTGELPKVNQTEAVMVGDKLVTIAGTYAERRGIEHVKLTYKIDGKRAKAEEVAALTA